jgi:hypothetical protein
VVDEPSYRLSIIEESSSRHNANLPLASHVPVDARPALHRHFSIRPAAPYVNAKEPIVLDALERYTDRLADAGIAPSMGNRLAPRPARPTD